MVKNRQLMNSLTGMVGEKSRVSIASIHFQNPRVASAGVDVLSLQELRVRAPHTLIEPQRVGFYLLMLIQEGECKHKVDFVEYSLKPGSVVFLRPGQVQQWQMNNQVQGLLMLVSDFSLSPAIGRADLNASLLALDQWPSVSSVSMGLFLQVLSDAGRLREEVKQFGATERETAIIWHTLMALLLRLARELRVGEVAANAEREARIYRLFCKELESGFHLRPTVEEYAQRLGYSHSTLSRACLAVVGLNAKAVIDQRIALEAKRLLVHSNITAADIGQQLGFLEPTNFLKFFRRMEGTTPQAYRIQLLKNTLG